MNKLIHHFILIGINVFFVAGCAKQEVVRKDEIVSSVTSSKSPVITNISEEPSTKKLAVRESKVQTSINDLSVKDNAHDINSEAQLQASLTRIYFGLDSFELSTNARDTLSKNVALLKQKVGIKLRIEGHCDERGSEEYNLALGERRANAALNYLVTMGIPVENLSIISYGKERPADPGHDEAAWNKNRRDEFVIVAK